MCNFKETQEVSYTAGLLFICLTCWAPYCCRSRFPLSGSCQGVAWDFSQPQEMFSCRMTDLWHLTMPCTQFYFLAGQSVHYASLDELRIFKRRQIPFSIKSEHPNLHRFCLFPLGKFSVAHSLVLNTLSLIFETWSFQQCTRLFSEMWFTKAKSSGFLQIELKPFNVSVSIIFFGDRVRMILRPWFPLSRLMK